MDEHVVIYVCDRCGYSTEDPNDIVTWVVNRNTQDLCRNCMTKVIDEEIQRLRKGGFAKGN